MTSNEPSNLVDELIAILRSESFRDPFFDAVRSGRMSRAGIKFWAIQASVVVKQFTRFVSAIHSNCPHREVQELLAENLWEEHGRGDVDRDHYSLVRRFAATFGATPDEIDHPEPLPETAAYVDHCLRITRDGSFIEGLAAIGIAIEHLMPLFFGGLAEALQRNYDVSETDIQYLLVHVHEDAEHSRRSREMLERYADSDDLRAKAKKALIDTLAVKRAFADAVYQGCLSAK